MGPEEKAYLAEEIKNVINFSSMMFVIFIGSVFITIPYNEIPIIGTIEAAIGISFCVGILGALRIWATWNEKVFPCMTKYESAWNQKHPKPVPPPVPTMETFMADVEKKFGEFARKDSPVKGWAVVAPFELEMKDCEDSICSKYPSFKCITADGCRNISIVPK